MADSEINTRPDATVRVYVDISQEIERKCRLRYVQLEAETGKRFNRRSYLEYLITQDTDKVKGASLSVVKQSASKQRK